MSPRPRLNGSVKQEVLHVRTLIQVVVMIAAIFTLFFGVMGRAEDRFATKEALAAEGEMREHCFGQVEQSLSRVESQQAVLDMKVDRMMIRLGVDRD